MQLIEKIIASYRFAPDSVPGRRYDLDWLRVLAFGLLIFYHIGMVYVARWGFHVKSPYASTHLESLMLLVNPWRMAILWFISGVAIRFVLAKVNKTRFLALRTVRLLLPLLFAVLVIIPPQLYCEMTQKGDLHHSYVEFLKAFFTWNHPLFAKYQAGILPHMDVNHLWYLRELWTFSLLLLLAMPIWNSRWFKSMMAWLATHVSVLVLGLVLINTGLEWVYREPRNQMGFLFLCFGFAIAWQEPFWQTLQRQRWKLVGLGLLSYLGLVNFYQTIWVHVSVQPPVGLHILGACLLSLQRVFCFMGVLGLARHYLNQKATALDYFNEAVYPYYILHQTLIVVGAFLLGPLALGPILEPLSLIAITVFGCALGFEVVRRIEFLRPFFGLKMSGQYKPVWKKVGRWAAAIVLLPLCFIILL